MDFVLLPKRDWGIFYLIETPEVVHWDNMSSEEQTDLLTYYTLFTPDFLLKLMTDVLVKQNLTALAQDLQQFASYNKE